MVQLGSFHVYNIVQGATTALLSASVHVYGGEILKMLKPAAALRGRQRRALIQIRKNFTAFRRYIGPAGAGAVVGFMLMSFWPLLRTRFAYLGPAMYIFSLNAMLFSVYLIKV